MFSLSVVWRTFHAMPSDALVGGDDAWLIIDGTALPKKDHASVGVALRYALVFRQKC